MGLENDVRSITFITIGLMTKNATAFKAIAGSTTVTNRRPNGTSTPRMNIATDKKIVPDSSVPNPTRTVDAIKLLVTFLTIKTIANTTNAVTNLSIMFGKRPSGKEENNPDITPVVMASKNTLRTSGNKKIPMNIIVNIKSGFIPPLIPGMTKYKAAPTATNIAIKTKFFVFISILSSAQLNFCFSYRILMIDSEKLIFDNTGSLVLMQA